LEKRTAFMGSNAAEEAMVRDVRRGEAGGKVGAGKTRKRLGDEDIDEGATVMRGPEGRGAEQKRLLR
jgi:hypothetical protein